MTTKPDAASALANVDKAHTEIGEAINTMIEADNERGIAFIAYSLGKASAYLELAQKTLSDAALSDRQGE